MARTEDIKRQDTKYDRLIPFYIAIVFVLFVSADIVFAYIAIKTHPGVTVQNAYDVGLKYNTLIKEAEEQEKSGIKSSLDWKIQGGQLNFDFILLDKNGTPLSGYKVSGRLVRPVQSGMDESSFFKEKKPGIYQAEQALPIKGIWKVLIKAEGKSGKIFSHTQDIVIK
jgi:nitrogen fixation protein FixH